MFTWGKPRPLNVIRKRREGDAAERAANAFPDRHLPERPTLDGYSVGELSADEAAQLLKERPVK